MKIIADFLKTLAAVVTSTAVVGSALLWFMMPRIDAWVQSISATAINPVAIQAEDNSEAMAMLSSQLSRLADQVTELNLDPRRTGKPILEFQSYGNEVTDASAGERVKITWFFTKDHDCGAPSIAAFFRNGGDVTHRFEDLSIVDENGVGVNMPAKPDTIQTITYSAVIPDDQEVHSGRARAWVTLRYPDCPWSPPSFSPEVAFNILP